MYDSGITGPYHFVALVQGLFFQNYGQNLKKQQVRIDFQQFAQHFLKVSEPEEEFNYYVGFKPKEKMKQVPVPSQLKPLIAFSVFKKARSNKEIL